MNWTATLEDGTALQQFPPEKGGKETLFSEIDLNSLVSFRVEDFGQTAEVWPQERKYAINDSFPESVDFDNNGDPLELIYFRRNRRTLGVGGVSMECSYIQCVGLRNRGETDTKNSKQVLIELGKNHKRILKK